MAYLSDKQIFKLGFKEVGKNVKISDKSSIHRPEKISIGDNTRIDDFVVISAGDGGIKIGKNIHIAVYTLLMGKGNITVEDYANFSSRVSIYSSNDDYSGKFMTNPTIDRQFTNVDDNDVYIGKHVIVGCGSVILPGAILKEGVAIGALSLVKAGTYKSFNIYAGIPTRLIKKRNTSVVKLENKFKSLSR